MGKAKAFKKRTPADIYAAVDRFKLAYEDVGLKLELQEAVQNRYPRSFFKVMRDGMQISSVCTLDEMKVFLHGYTLAL